jgi:hypothetical protein
MFPILGRKEKGLRLLRKKRGVSPAIGVLLMVGILLTAIMPLFVSVRAINNTYDTTTEMMELADRERDLESIKIIAYGNSESSNSIDLFIINEGSITVDIERIWVMRTDLQKELIFNSTNHPLLPLQIQISSQASIEDLDLTPILEKEDKDYFNMFVISRRGKKYKTESNTFHLADDDWEWSDERYTIRVMLQSSWGQNDYKIEAIGVDDRTSGFESEVELENQHGYSITVFQPPINGVYNVTLWRKQSGDFVYIDTTTAVLTEAIPITKVEFNDL